MMRKLLHIIYGVLTTGLPYDAHKAFPIERAKEALTPVIHRYSLSRELRVVARQEV